MNTFPQSKNSFLARPFLEEKNWHLLKFQLEEALEMIHPGESVLCAERDPMRTVAVVMATLLRGGGIFLANPDWSEHELESLNQIASFHKVFGALGVEANPTYASGFEEARLMVPSGGSSGALRFCVHSLDTLSAGVKQLWQFHGKADLSSINCLPLFHVSGLMPVFRACLTGGQVIFHSWSELLSGNFPSHIEGHWSLSLVPTQLGRLLRSETAVRFLHGMDVVYLGGAGPSSDLVQAIRTEKLPIHFVYGMTETAAMAVIGSRAESTPGGRIWGSPLPGVSAQLTEEGEIVLRSDSVFRGYYPEDSTRKEFATGDFGEWAGNGQLCVFGRKDFLINTGGEKVAPEEVEAALSGLLPDRTFGVLGVTDPDWGQRVVALVEGSLDELMIQNILETLPRYLAPFKIPKEIRSVDCLPKSALGKLDRKALKELY